MNSPTELPNKKVYRTPSLIRYGSLTEMTTAITNNGPTDNGQKILHKTG
jgi:hypothetical protein